MMQIAAISGATSAVEHPANASQSGLSARLMNGLGLSSILWALLSGTSVRLLDVALKTVSPVPDA